MYIPGTYVVVWTDSNGFHRGPVIDTELEARNLGNRIWKNHDVTEVEIVKCIYKSKRRYPVTIASAHK